MNYIKLFENFQNLENIKNDIDGIFVWLNDESEFDVRVKVYDYFDTKNGIKGSNKLYYKIEIDIFHDDSDNRSSVEEQDFSPTINGPSSDIFYDEIIMLSDYISSMFNDYEYTTVYDYRDGNGWVEVDSFYSEGTDSIKSDEFSIVIKIDVK